MAEKKPTPAQRRTLDLLVQPEAGIVFDFLYSNYRLFTGTDVPTQSSLGDYRNRVDPHLFDRLRDAGWVAHEKTVGEGHHRKAAYRITDAGRLSIQQRAGDRE